MRIQYIVLFLLTTIVSFSLSPVVGYAGFSIFDHAKTVQAVNGEVILSVQDVNDGVAHHYSYKDNGRTIKFFVVKSSDGVIRAAFDACDVCFPSKKGYSQQGEFMVCNNCGRKFHSTRINVEQGGCNPAPLQREVRGEQLVIAVADIRTGARYF